MKDYLPSNLYLRSTSFAPFAQGAEPLLHQISQWLEEPADNACASVDPPRLDPPVLLPAWKHASCPLFSPENLLQYQRKEMSVVQDGKTDDLCLDWQMLVKRPSLLHQKHQVLLALMML